MTIRNRAKAMIVAASVVGAVGIAGTAFTATGLTNNAGPSQFVGGAITQDVTGAALTSATYAYSDGPANTSVNSLALVFDASSAGRTVAVTLHQGATDTNLTCQSDDGSPVDNAIGTAIYGVNCVVDNATGVTGITVAVS